jgi:predicted NAD-dependent protein-ADP-ribosyltransferase YbiA (DUF1768 family)
MSKPNQKQMAQQVPMKILNERLQRKREEMQIREQYHLTHPVGLSPAQMNTHETYLEDMKFDQFCVDDTKKEIQQWEDCKRILRVRHAPKKHWKNLERKIRRTRKTLKFFEGELRTGKRAVKDIVLGQ